MSHDEKGKWWVSPSNYDEEVRQDYHFAPRIEILDTTLRDGEQQAGIVLNLKDKVKIARKLDEVGVHRIEAGTPATSDEDAQAIKEIAALKLKAKIFCFCRAMPKDMELAKSLGVDGVICEIIGSEEMLKFGKRWTPEQAAAACIEATKVAHDMGLYVTLFPADGSRARLQYLIDFVDKVSAQGHIDSLALVDTFGAFSPEGAALRIRKLKERFSFPVEAHFHADYDLGVASTIAALKEGAAVAHVSVNGIGERAGSVGLEALAVCLEALYGVDTGIKLNKLLELSALVAELTNFPVAPNKPFVGNRLFGWSTGLPSSLWTNAKQENPLIMLPYHYDLIGAKEPVLYLDKKSGKDNLKYWLKKVGLSVPEEKERELLDLAKAKSLEVKRDLNEAEFKELAAKVA
ncbi:MAG: pyruvate carboxyltransferase [Candidatus Adiutrix sp.]|jgi:isopropylmalate/homocitrate/citramalate synthase|nr:pyruvate carboxyltransferase [Candidatus Adiutrix sp.]